MILARRTWCHRQDGLRVEVIHLTGWNLKTRLELRSDGVLVAQTPWRMNLRPISVSAALPGGSIVAATAGYCRFGVRRVHSLRVDDVLVAGLETVRDMLGDQYAGRSPAITALAMAVPSTLVYCLIMGLAGQFDGRSMPGALIKAAAIFGGLMFMVYWLIGKWVVHRDSHKDRRDSH